MTDMFQAARSFMRYALEDGISEKALRMALQQERVVEADDRARAQVSPRGKGVSVGQRVDRDAGWRERHQGGETTAAIAASEGVDRRTVERGIERAA